MPKIFKALTTIMAWILWIFALVTGFSTLVLGIASGDLFKVNTIPPIQYTALFAIAGFYAILAAVIMLIRKKME